MNRHAARRQKLAAAIRKAELDALFVTNPFNVTYLTGFTGDSSFVIVSPKKTILVSDRRFEIQIAQECPGLETNIRNYDKTTLAAAIESLTALKMLNIGIESNHISLGHFEKLRDALPALNFERTENMVEELRAIKDSQEITAVREAVRMAEKAYEMFRAMLRPEDSEKELADAMEQYLRRAGAKCSGFDIIVGIGDRSALPHAPVSERRVEEADFLLLDWGAWGPLYQSDLTRVIPAPDSGDSARRRARRKVESELRKIYTVVLRAQERAIAAIRPGVSVKEVDAAARGYIADAGYGDYFNHGLGHGIGLQTHELPDIRSTSDHVLQAGMIVTIEPGIYLEGFAGVRLEDDILVTPDGHEVLSSLPKQWDAIWSNP